MWFSDPQDGQSRTIRQFQFTDWPEQGVPKTGEGFIDFIGQVHKTKEQFGQDGPITVHCRYREPKTHQTQSQNQARPAAFLQAAYRVSKTLIVQQIERMTCCESWVGHHTQSSISGKVSAVTSSPSQLTAAGGADPD